MKKSQKRRHRIPHTSSSKPLSGGATSPTRPRWLSRALWFTALVGVVGLLLWKQFGRDKVQDLTPAIGQTNRGISGLTYAVPGMTNLTAATAAKQRDNAATILNGRANDLLKAGDTAGAIQAYKEAIAFTPDDEDLHFNLGIAYARNGDVTNAEHEYQEALRLLPDYPEVHNNLGNLLLRAGRGSEAEEHFVEALKQMPEYAQAHNNLGIVRQRQARFEDALECFQKAVKYDTNYWEAHFNLANSYLRQKDRDKAIAEFRETLRINPSFELGQKALAKALSPQPDMGK